MSWIGRAAGAVLGLLAASSAPAALAAGGFADHAPEIIADLRDLREPSMFEASGHSVAEVDGGYVLTLEDVRFLPSEKGYVEAGDVVARFVAEPGGYRITSFELPQEMPVRQEGNQGFAGSAKLASYEIGGFWSIAERAFLSLDIAVSGLQLIDPDRTAMSVDSGRSSFIDTQGANGLWREEGQMEIRGLVVDVGAAVSDVGELMMSWTADDIDRAAVELFKREFAAAFGDGGRPLAAAELKRLRAFGSLFANGRSVLEIRDARGGAGTTIDYGRIELVGRGFDQELSGLDMRMQFDGIGVSALTSDALTTAIAPRSIDIILALDDLPGRAFWDGLLDSMAPHAMAPDEAGMRLGLALQDAGTKLRIDESRLSSEVVDLQMEGMIQAHAPAMLGAVIALSLDVAGLDALSALVATAPDSADAAPVRQLVDWLERHGREVSAPNGDPARHVDIVIDESGQLTVNGRPLPLFGEPPSQMEN